MTPSETATRAIEELARFWGGFEFADFNKRDPWRILVSAIISHRTQDNVTYPATERLFSKWPDVRSLSLADPDEVAKVIFPAGFYKTKSQRLVQMAIFITSQYGGKVPDSLDELLRIKGVGRKTANLVLSLGYNIPSVVVDTHVHRISNRAGWVKTQTPEQTEFELMKLLPKKYWTKSNELLVRLGQNICKPIVPKCEQCPICPMCVMGSSVKKN